jgi:hypothetical protein
VSKAICERCGKEELSGAHLAGHLKYEHGMGAHEAIVESRKMRDRYNDRDARIRDAAPDLLAALEHLVSYGDSYRHRLDQPSEAYTQARAALAKAKGDAQ